MRMRIGLVYLLLALLCPSLATALTCAELLAGLPNYPTQLAHVIELLPRETQFLLTQQLPPPEAIIDHNRALYSRARGDKEYLHELTNSFSEYRASLPPGSIWIDVGPGVQRAQSQYDLNPPTSNSSTLKSIGIGLKNPLIIRAKFAILHPLEWLISKRLSFIETRIETLPEESKHELSSQKDHVLLITDVSAALAYSKDFRATLQAELELLPPGGRLYTNFHPQDVEFYGRQTATHLDFLDWLNRSRGFKVVESFKNTNTLEEYILGGITLERTNEPLVFPHLIVAYSDNGQPPHRVFISLDF